MCLTGEDQASFWPSNQDATKNRFSNRMLPLYAGSSSSCTGTSFIFSFRAGEAQWQEGPYCTLKKKKKANQSSVISELCDFSAMNITCCQGGSLESESSAGNKVPASLLEPRSFWTEKYFNYFMQRVAFSFWQAEAEEKVAMQPSKQLLSWGVQELRTFTNRNCLEKYKQAEFYDCFQFSCLSSSCFWVYLANVGEGS